MTTSSMIVIHGVANHNRDQFLESVGSFSKSLGRTVGEDVFPVHWGHLGPEENDPFEAVPTDQDRQLLPSVSVEALDDRALPQDVAAFLGEGVAGAEQDVVAATAKETIAAVERQTGEAVPEATADAIHAAVAEAATSGVALSLDPTLADALAEVVIVAPPQGRAGAEGLGFSNLADSFKRILRSVDRKLGEVAGGVLQKALRGAQAELSDVAAQTLGDVLSYEAGARDIRGCLDVEFSKASATGRPVDIVAHSLGALVAVDWLSGAKCIRGDGMPETQHMERRVRTLVTFGTQVSLFAEIHGLEDANGRRNRVPDGTRDVLPMSVEKWVNVWHQLDPLAFVMSRVLKYGSEDAPSTVEDMKLILQSFPSSPSELWFHSSYWKDERFLSWMRSELGNGA